MNCQDVTEQLGAYVDEELSSELRATVEQHVGECEACANKLDELRGLAASLAAAETTRVPDELWGAIERGLDGDRSEVFRRHVAVRRMARLPWALAAVIALAVGLGLVGLLRTDSSARASSVDFSVLLDALPHDAKQAFTKFVSHYDAKEASPEEAKLYAPELNFEVPQELPGGFLREAVYVLHFGELAGVAATYNRDGEFLGVVFHRPVHVGHCKPHKDYPCVVGHQTGHKVSVGEWRLVHLMDPTTCHCVLSRLNEQTELPPIMSAVAPELPGGARTDHD